MSLDTLLTQGEKAITRLTAATERELIKAYIESLKVARSQLAEAYAKYGNEDGTLNHSDMMKYGRLAKLEQQISIEIKRLTGSTAKTLTRGLGETYIEAYYRTAFAVESEAQARLAYGIINPKVIEASIQNPISGLTLSARLVQSRATVIVAVRQQITQGLIRGESYQKMASRVKVVFDGDATKARRVVQTEAHRVQQEGRMASFEKAESRGVRMVKVWVAALDDRTRDSHAELDGQKVPMDGMFRIRGVSASSPGHFGVAEEDINCRCSVRAEIEGYEPAVRRARGEGVIPYTTYKDWRANRVSP